MPPYNLYDTRICEAWKQVVNSEEDAARTYWQRMELLKQQARAGSQGGSPRPPSALASPAALGSAKSSRSMGSRPSSGSSSKSLRLMAMEQKLSELSVEVKQCRKHNAKMESKLRTMTSSRMGPQG
mmetsp:Transcript_11372/g.29190  ORF Transcript_11372/g.29190 Transcript_11372/m.29190 type:complete len:126 (-) Transcript_11372:198-575(-)